MLEKIFLFFNGDWQPIFQLSVDDNAILNVVSVCNHKHSSEMAYNAQNVYDQSECVLIQPFPISNCHLVDQSR